MLAPSKETRGETARLTADVEVVEPLGDEIIVHGRVGDEVLVYKLDPHDMPEIGQKLEVVVELDRMHLFDVETERRLAA
jgi:multiple sugar transport system ATP-binding protein